jgi:geranylgeranyl diphosphate synthase type II
MAETAARAARPRRALRAMLEIAEAAGPRGMVGGQAADLRAEGGVPDLATVEYIHVRKTGALILSCVRAGAFLGGARPTELRRLTRYGELVGVAFQIADDVLDAEAPSRVTGKERGRDAVRQKATFPAVLGLPAAKARARELLDEALAELAGFPRRAEALRAIARHIVERACGPSRQLRGASAKPTD